MPVLTFPLAVLLAACFVGGSLLTWLLAERRARRERDELERQMTRALQTRYEVYEGLERSVVKLMTRFDAMEGEFKQKLELARNPRAANEPTITLRSSNPELWDIEREHHRVHSEQSSEIGRLGARVHELMGQLDAVEPGLRALEGELAGLKARYENAVANSTEAERAACAKIERLTGRVGELEPLESLLEASRREVAALQMAQRERDGAHAAQVKALEASVATLRLAEERVGQLEQALARREHELAEGGRRVAGLEGELGGLRADLDTARSRCTALAGERDAATASTAQLQATLEATRSSQAALQAECERTRAALADATTRCENQKATIGDALAASDALEADLAATQKWLAERDQKIAALERTLVASQAEHEARWTAAQQENTELRGGLKAANAKCAQFESSLAQLQGELDGARSQAQAAAGKAHEERAALETALATARQDGVELRDGLAAANARCAQFESSLAQLQGELDGARSQAQAAAGKAHEERVQLESALVAAQAQIGIYRAKLNHHSSHVEEAWTVLTELKPMLETLEQKLKDSDGPAPALPARKFDLSVLDEPRQAG